MESLSLGKILNIFKKNNRVILLFSVTGLAAGVLYAVTIFKPMYNSTAQLLIKNTDQPVFVTELNTMNGISPLTRDGNPALTQIQILSTEKLADEVWKKISAKYKFTDDSQTGVQLMQKAINVDNPVGTDIIEITASWNDPKIAKDIASEFTSAYIASNIDISKKSITQSQNAIDKELVNAQMNLQNVRDKIKQFRQENSTVNLEVESSNIVTQLSDLENKYNETIASANSERNKAGTVAGKLGINWRSAINSVALGHNTNFTALQSKLGETQEELVGLSTKYAPTHPAMLALNSKVTQIKSELDSQVKQTLGNSGNNTNGILISDPVRTTMMENLVTSEAAYKGLVAEGGALKSAMNNLVAKKSAIPAKQLVLSNLLQDEANWSQIVNTLKNKQLEAKIKESGIVSNINIIDNPIVPLLPVFPGRIPVAGLFAIFGGLLGIASTLVSYLIKDTYDDPEEIEEELKAPVLGVIPWLDKQTYDDPGSLLADDNASFYSLAYQKVVSSLRIRGYNSEKNCFAFSSTEFSKDRSTILMNIAYGLNKAGKSVIVVDADFRTPSIHKEFGLPVNDQFNLGELLINITKETRDNGEFNWKYLSYFTHELSDSANLYILPNNGNISNPNEFLYSSAFSTLIQKLKEQYEWVLLDTPPALAVSDAATISSYVDGIVLISGLETTKSTIKKVHKLFNNHNIPIFGIIAREIQQNEAVLSNGYIKQIISNMMPSSEDAYVEK